jgi:hypothetical protein
VDYVDQEIVVRGTKGEGPGASIVTAGDLFQRIADTVRPCVRMALTGRSTRVGTPPSWLKIACDVRALGFERRDTDLILKFGVPRLGDAAPKAFEQGLLFESSVQQSETALDLMGSMIRDVKDRKAESNTYDEAMLTSLVHWNSLLKTRIKTVVLPKREGESASVLDEDVLAGAASLNSRIPEPRQVRVVGHIDMVRYSTRALGLRLANGDEVRCSVVNEDIGDLRGFGNRDVTVLGKAIYRPSGTVLRLDVEAILDTTVGREQHSSVPIPFETRQLVERRPQSAKSGVAAIFGSWPGEETDEELQAALAELRG